MVEQGYEHENILTHELAEFLVSQIVFFGYNKQKNIAEVMMKI